MKLHDPFIITARLAPGLKVGDAFLSFDNGAFVLDFADGSEHRITGFHFPRCRIAGDTDESVLQAGFASILAFLGACAESRSYARRRGKDEMEGENSNLFPPEVGAWAEQNSNKIDSLRFEIEEQKGLIEA